MKMRRIGALTMAWLLVLLLCVGCGKEEDAAWKTAYETTGTMLSETGDVTVGSMGGEWLIIGLSRSGRLTDEMAQAYLKEADSYVRETAQAGRLHPKKSTDNSRVILGVTAAGGDPTDIGGVDLTSGLTDMDYLKIQGNNGPIWALIALDCGGYEIPKNENPAAQVTREGLVAHLLSLQQEDGGWGLMGKDTGTDMTAMALQALAPYREEERVAAAVKKGVAFLSKLQQEDGGYAAFGSDSSESCAQVVVALTALGIDPAKDERFEKGGKTVLDALCSYGLEEGGFFHTREQPLLNGMATEQGYYALTAYDRFCRGESTLYDMTDIMD